MNSQTIGIGSLLLDPQNPRHDLVTSQRDAIRAIIDEQGTKLGALARDVAENGLSPLDRVLVIRKGRNFIVVEGNRRVAAVKLLHNPDLAKGTGLESAIQKAAESATPPETIECAVAPSRDAARHWMVLRHTGEQEGAGVVPWNALASGRFHAKPGSQTAKAITFIDAVQAAYPQNVAIQDALDTIMSGRVTTLGRLVADPSFRSHLGLQDEDGTLVTHYPNKELEPILERLLGDVATHVSVTQLKTKDQRSKYIGKLPKPKSGAYQENAQPLASGGAGTQRSPTRRAPRPGSPFKSLDLQKLGTRIDSIVQELRKLDVSKTPNAAAIMTRVLLELSVDEFIAKKNLTTGGELKTRVKRALHEVDPTDKDTTYQGIRAGLSDGTSMMSISTLHGYVHNQHFHPGPTDVRSIVANLKPILQAMNDRA